MVETAGVLPYLFRVFQQTRLIEVIRFKFHTQFFQRVGRFEKLLRHVADKSVTNTGETTLFTHIRNEDYRLRFIDASYRHLQPITTADGSHGARRIILSRRLITLGEREVGIPCNIVVHILDRGMCHNIEFLGSAVAKNLKERIGDLLAYHRIIRHDTQPVCGRTGTQYLTFRIHND